MLFCHELCRSSRSSWLLSQLLVQLLRSERRRVSPHFSASIPWGAHYPVATLQHLVNLQAPFPSVKESTAYSARHAIQLLLLWQASVNSEDAFTPAAGWPDFHVIPAFKNGRLFLCRLRSPRDFALDSRCSAFSRGRPNVRGASRASLLGAGLSCRARSLRQASALARSSTHWGLFLG